MVEGGFAPAAPVTPLNLKDRLAALGSNRIGLDLHWSRLAPRSCWPGLPFDFETNFVNGRALRGLSDRLSVPEPCLFLAHGCPNVAAQQVGSYLGYRGCVATPFGKAAHDPQRRLPQWAYRAPLGFDLKH